eukprot:Opistho-1_new@58924
MRGAGRVDHQAAAIADIGEVAEDLESFDKGLALLAMALDVEAEHRAGAARQQLLRQYMAGVRLQHRVADARHQRVAGEKSHDFFGVGHVARHAQRQGLYALQDQPGGVRAHAGAEVAQAFAARAQQKGAHRAFLGEHHVVKAVVGLAQLGEFAGLVPVETAAIDHDAANHRAVAAQKLCRRVIHDVSAVLERLDEPGRGQGGVHQQRHPGLMRDGRDGGHVQHVETGVAHGFTEKKFGFGPHGVAPAVYVAGFDKGGFNAEAPHGVVQQVLRAAVQRRGGHDVGASAHQGGDAQVQRRLAAGGGDGAYAAFECGDALLQHRIGRVADA